MDLRVLGLLGLKGQSVEGLFGFKGSRFIGVYKSSGFIRVLGLGFRVAELP